MLALVHPVPHNPSTDSPHHTTSRLPRPPRKPHSVASSSVVASSSTSFSRLASAQPPQATRHLPAPALSTTTTPLALKHTQSQPLPNGRQSPLRPASPVTKHPPAPTTPAPAAFDIHAYPAQELLKLLASLLTQIAATNDQLSPTSPTQPNAPSQSPLPSMDHEPPIWHTLTTASRTALATPSSTLTFHARNIPTISLEAYLLRILKYCPTTNEVFLSLLVYFDRMSKLSNEATGKMFIIDSYNIHRLVIAGVTVASKFFSDVFYTNSRYAKVGGLPLQELNLLELQFLLLNDFRLVISGKEMQHYAEQLIRFSHAGTNGHARVSPAPRTHSRPLSPTAPMRAMGALDAEAGTPYAREFTASSRPQPPAHTTRSSSTTQRRNAYPPASDTALQYSPFASAGSTTPGGSVANNKTPSVRPRRPSYVDDEEPEPGTDTENETEAGTETDSGETTDDEPTIRPPHSSASSETDNRSLCSTSTFESEGEDEDEEGEANEMVVEVEMGVNGESGPDGPLSDEDDGKRNDGDLTPERPGKGLRGGDGDVDVDDHRMASP